jgi:hypothetical protein
LNVNRCSGTHFNVLEHLFTFGKVPEHSLLFRTIQLQKKDLRVMKIF